MRPSTRLAFLVAVVAGFVAGCSASDSPSTSGTPNPSSAAVEVCPEIDLRMPNGDRLHLSGRWLANDGGSYFLSQRRSCLFWMGQSPPADGYPAGAVWTNVFSGRIVSSFVIAGPWTDVPAVTGASADGGELTLGIEFFELNGVTWPALAMQSQEPQSVFGGSAWQPEESLPEVESFTGTYGHDDPHCPWLEVDGQRYTLVGKAYVQGQHIFSRESGPGVLEGAQAHVEAQLAPALGPPDCQSSALLVRDLYPAP